MLGLKGVQVLFLAGENQGDDLERIKAFSLLDGRLAVVV